MSNLAMLISCLLILAVCWTTTAEYTTKEIEDIVKVHNKHRRKEHASNMETMYWDGQLAAMAQEWANRCVYKHGQPSNVHSSWVKPGQNLYISSQKNVPDTDPEIAWWEEIHYYNYEHETCQADQQCGHYTQVIWAESNRVGCGQKWCEANGQVMPFDALYVVCNYGPPGNWWGEKPYLEGKHCTACGNDTQKYCNEGLCDECHGSGCACKVTCQHGGSRTPDCGCKCAEGFIGKFCEKPCRDTNEYCDPQNGEAGWPRSWCSHADKPYVKEGCPKFCGLC